MTSEQTKPAGAQELLSWQHLCPCGSQVQPCCIGRNAVVRSFFQLLAKAMLHPTVPIIITLAIYCNILFVKNSTLATSPELSVACPNTFEPLVGFGHAILQPDPSNKCFWKKRSSRQGNDLVLNGTTEQCSPQYRYYNRCSTGTIKASLVSFVALVCRQTSFTVEEVVGAKSELLQPTVKAAVQGKMIVSRICKSLTSWNQFALRYKKATSPRYSKEHCADSRTSPDFTSCEHRNVCQKPGSLQSLDLACQP